jgi:spermidine synthase
MYAFNTVGGILGSALVGFGLLGALGVHGSLRALALLNAALAAAALRLARPARGLRRAAALAFAAAVLFVATRRDPTLDILAARLDARLRLLFHEEDAAATVTGAALGSGRTLFINGIEIAGNGHAGALMAFLPNLLLESPRSALVICFGAGQTFRTASLLSSRVDAVELLEPVLRHAGDFLPDVPALMSAPGRAVYAEDGRQFLLRSRSRYDSIIVDAAPPLFSAGAVNLYTREFMDLARARLADDGVFALWLPLRSFESDYWSILRGVGQGFEHVAVWSHPSAEGFLVLASRRPIRPPAEAELSRRIRERLAPLGPDAVRGVRADALLAGFVLSEEDLRAYAGRYPVVTDDRPLTEFPLWRFLRDEPLMADARFLLKARR